MNRRLLTPFLLDTRIRALDRLATPEWSLNAPTLIATDTMTRMGEWQRPLADVVTTAIKEGQRPISVGADCCQTVPVMAGLRRAGIAPVLVWLDAHGDFNTWETSPSGFVGGMALAMLVGRGDQQLLQQLELAPIPETDVILTDARDLDPEERASLEGSAVTHVHDIEQLLARIPAERPLYVHFDVDIIDANDAPATMYPVQGGPSLGAMLDIAARLRGTNRIVAVSMTTWALDRDVNHHTERACMNVLNALIA
jgi:arginase